MIVSVKWLADYVTLPSSLEELTERWTLSGLNLEGVEAVGDDTAVDLEVTSNRPDCLGHIGVAREVAVLYDKRLALPELSSDKESGAAPPVSVSVTCPELCPRYTARLIRNVRIGPSPAWLADRLRTLGIAVINNVVDATNYVMMECGQPLHAFDFGKLAGGAITVRRSHPGEKFVAINHKEYELPDDTCVIADAQDAVALAGVMGGAETEVSETTAHVLLESADFAPLAVRNVARRLSLHSPSSYRFERGVDPEGVLWASRRCAELIAEIAGGEVVAGVADSGAPDATRDEIKLRFDQLPRVLGISVPDQRVRDILTALGCQETHACDHCIKVIPPSWRADLTREIDLVEEVARIHGYDQIPEDAGVKMVASTRSREDRILERVRTAMTAGGFHEAMTLSAVDPDETRLLTPWTEAEPLRTSTPVLRRADCLRQSLAPSLLAARRHNETVSNPVIELFEIAHVYLPRKGDLPQEKRVLAVTTGRGYLALKGVAETLASLLRIAPAVQAAPCDAPLFDAARSATLRLGDRTLGLIGELSSAGLEATGLRRDAAAGEFDLDLLMELAELATPLTPLSPYPPMGRDLNVVVDDQVTWAEVSEIAEQAGGELVETIAYQDTYRDDKRLGRGKKSLLFSVQLRAPDKTLTGEQADAVRDQIVAALAKQVGAELRT